MVFAMFIAGALNAATVLAMMWGAILLFGVMELTGCLTWIIKRLDIACHGHPVAQLAILGYGFVNLLEGAAGFGTPVAVIAPILVSSGHAPLEAASLLLVTDGLCTLFGGGGIPMWFGFADE